MKKEIYTSPVVELMVVSEKDMLLQSDVVIDGSGLFAEE